MTIDLEKLWSQVQGVGADFGFNIISAIAIFVIGRWVARALTSAVKRAMHRNDVEDTLETFIGNIVYAGLMICVILAALNALGVQTASIIAVVGAAGLAIGLALQGSLSNFAAGVLIILFKPYRVGDYIEAGGVSGSVEGLQIFTTTLRTPDNKLVIVPNSQITGGAITNYSANDTRRLDLTVGVSYSDNLADVRRLLEDILGSHKNVLKEPAWTIGVHTLADSSVNFVVRPWVRTEHYWPTWFELTEQIKNRFDAEGITIPFPQQTVHLRRA